MAKTVVEVLVTFSVQVSYDPDLINEEVLEHYSDVTIRSTEPEQLIGDLAVEKIEKEFDGSFHPVLGNLQDIGIKIGKAKLVSLDMEE